MTIKVVTDSVSDLPPGLVDELGVTVVPAKVLFGSEEFSDGVDITTDQFFERLAADPVLPKTSQPSVGEFAEVYRRVAQDADGIVSVHVSSKVSGTYNSAVQAREHAGVACPIEVVDSMQASMGEGMVAIAAARAAQAGGSLEEVAQAARDARPRAQMLGLLDTLEYLQRGGRIGKARALVGSLLKVKPMIIIQEGEAHEFGKERTRAKGLAKLQQFAEDHAPLEEACVLHTTDSAGLDGLTESLKALLPPGKQPITARMGPVLGVYVGPGSVGLALLAAS